MNTEEIRRKINNLYQYIEDNCLRGKKRLEILIEIQDLENELNYREGYIDLY